MILPWLALLAAVAAVCAPRSGLRSVVIGLGLGTAAAMAVLLLLVLIGRGMVLDAVPACTVSPAAARVLLDTVLASLWAAVRIVFLGCLAVAAAAFLGSPSGAGRTLRANTVRGAALLAGRDPAGRTLPGGPCRADPAVADPAGRTLPWRTLPWQRWPVRQRRLLQAAVVLLAVLVLVFWNYPTAAVAAVGGCHCGAAGACLCRYGRANGNRRPG